MSYWTINTVSTLQDYISKNSKLFPLSISNTCSGSVNIHTESNVIIQIVNDITCNGVVIQHDKSILFLNKYICEILLYIKKSLHDKLIIAPLSIDALVITPHISNDGDSNRIPIHIEQISPLYTRNIYVSAITKTTNTTNTTNITDITNTTDTTDITDTTNITDIITYQLSNVCIDYHCHNYTSLWLYWHKIINALISSSVIDNATNKYNFELKKELDSIYSTIDKEFNKSFTDGIQTYLKYQKYNHVCVVDTGCLICNDFSALCGHLIKLLISKLNQCNCNVIKLNTLL
jgi:hypothetical protein